MDMTSFVSGESRNDRDTPGPRTSAPSQDVRACCPEDKYPWSATYNVLESEAQAIYDSVPLKF